MSLNLSEPVTTNGTLKLTQAEYDYLNSFLAANDRGNYYLALYNMTGSQEALLQAEIATFSAGAGGAALLANKLIKANNATTYTLDVHEFSLRIARSSLTAIADKINVDGNNANTGIITDEEMLDSAHQVWIDLGMGPLFPGNAIMAANDLTNYLTTHGIVLPSQLNAASLLVNAVVDSILEADTSLDNFIDHLGAPGTLYAVVAALGGSPLMGLQLSDFESNPDRYRIVELPDAAYKAVFDNQTNKVVAVSRFESFPTTIAGIIDTISQYLPDIALARVGGLPGYITSAFVTDALRSYLQDFRYANMDHNNSVSPATPHHAEATNGDDTLWGMGGIFSSFHADTINGGGGNDRIFGGDGDDVLHGDAGNDIVYGQDNDDELYGDAGDDILRGGLGADTLNGGDGNDQLDGGDMTGMDDSVDKLDGGLGNDLLVGGGGDDELKGGKGFDTLEGGAGNDAYIYTSGDGFDAIVDSDGLGTIQEDGITLGVGKQIGDNRAYQFTDGNGKKHTYVFVTGNKDTGGDIVVDGNMLIRGFQAGNLGLGLAGPETFTPIAPTLTGDRKPLDTDPNTDGVQPGQDANGNLITDPGQPDAGRKDVFNGSAGKDRFQGMGGQDMLKGNGGDDVLEGGTDDDILAGGIGDDYLFADKFVAAGQAITDGNSQTGSGLKGDWLAGEQGSDTLVGGTGDDVLAGGSGNDLLIGGAGDDDIIGDANWTVQDFAWGITTANGQRFYNGAVGEMAPADFGDDVVYAGKGNDYVWTGQGNDAIFGEDGNDSLNAQEGNDIVSGGAGNDTVNGMQGEDVLIGGTGDDALIGGSGQDTYIINAGDGVDSIIDSVNNNSLIFGAGIDKNTIKLGLTHTLAANVENLALTGSSAINGTGNTLGNLLAGNGLANILNGKEGNDTLTGGAGTDIFLFDTILNSTTNKDVITDFNVVDDTIRLENAIFSKFTATGSLNAANFVKGAGAKALDANDYLVYNTTTGSLSYDADGNGAGAQVEIVTLTGIPALTAADFNIV